MFDFIAKMFVVYKVFIIYVDCHIDMEQNNLKQNLGRICK